MRLEPEREPWPLWPRVEVLPMPEPIPRPTRFLFSLAFLGARRLERLRIAICVSSLNAGGLVVQRLAFSGADGAPGVLIVYSTTAYSTTRTRCGILATMPRMEGVASRSTIWLRRVKPRPLTTSLCFTGVQILERTYCSLMVALVAVMGLVLLKNLFSKSLELFDCFATQGGYFGLVAQ